MADTFITQTNSRYGAPMGRHTGPHFVDVNAGRLYLRRVYLNNGGYDRGGAYWGVGTPLYEVLDHDGNGFIFRAPNRYCAKKQVIADFPGATFFR